MASKQEIVNFLNGVSSSNPGNVTSRLTRGVRVEKSAVYSYEIDDVNADEKLGVFPVGAIPYRPINDALRSSGSDIRALFKDSDCIPFSRALRAGVGQCLEKAILVQLAAQRKEESYLVNGAIELDDEFGAVFHAFNLVARGDYMYLVDAENPIGKDENGKFTRPYVVPVREIAPNGTIIVPEEYRAGRTYCLS